MYNVVFQTQVYLKTNLQPCFQTNIHLKANEATGLHCCFLRRSALKHRRCNEFTNLYLNNRTPKNYRRKSSTPLSLIRTPLEHQRCNSFTELLLRQKCT